MAFTLLRPRTALHIASDTGPRSGPVVVAVHGIASSAATFAPVITHLPEHRVIALDLFGFGRTIAPATARYTIAEHAAALDAAIDGLRLRSPFLLIGHSLGALAVSRYAAGRPRGLSAVVLVAPPVYVPSSVLPDGPTRTAMGLYLHSFDYLRANKRFTMRLARLVSRLLREPELLSITDRNWNAFERSLKNAIETQTTVADIAATRVPVEIVYGTLDPFVVPEMITLIEALRQVHVHRVPFSGHIIGTRMARAVADAVTQHTPPS